MNEILAYAAVLVAAAVPWFELFAIPPAIALGLQPVLVAVLAFVGNAGTTVAVVAGWDRVTAWWQRRRRAQDGISPRDATTPQDEARPQDGTTPEDHDRAPATRSGFMARRSARAARAFERYGVPGLALQGPMVTGIYLAAVLALGLGAPRRSVLIWSVASIALWTVVLAGLTVAGVEVLGA